MKILGLNAYHADASAALFIDGKLIAAIEEERFTRVKHWAGFPERSIRYCLEEGKIGLHELDAIAIGRDPYAKLFNKLWYGVQHPQSILYAIRHRMNNAGKIKDLKGTLTDIFENKTSGHFPTIHYIEHHRAHLASAYFASGYKDAAIISIDGSGDHSTTMRAIGNGNKIEVIDSIDYPHSLGLFYSAFTQFLGFPHYGDEYKVMGLAPYGKPVYRDRLKKIIELKKDGTFSLDLSFFRSPSKGLVTYDNEQPVIPRLFEKKMEHVFGSFRNKDEVIDHRHKDLAASVQKVTEDVIFHMLNDLYRRTGADRLCIAGGVAQNSVANGKILQSTPFKEVYVPSAGHDAGISMGAALWVQHQLKGSPVQAGIMSAYTGSHYDTASIISCLCEKGIVHEVYDERQLLYEKVINCLKEGGVVGWFQGRAEFGPRALGGRSILADPRRADAKDILNTKIKRRESFRPFAPSILKEYVAEYFEDPQSVPFMEKVLMIKEEKRQLIPAVTHVDGTGRLQTVDRTFSPVYYQLMETFRQHTGIPILLNTSFNENEPIVNTPEEAIQCFLRTDMDMLVMENVLVRR